MATVAREIDDLEKRMADLDKLRQKLAAIAQKSQDAADALSEEIAELSSDQEKNNKRLADLQAAEDLKAQHATGN